MSAPKPIHFTFQVIKVQTLTDAGIRLTIDISATDADTAAAMMKAKATNSLVDCAALFVKPQPVNVRQDEPRTSRTSPYIEARKEKGIKAKGKTKQ